VGKKTLPTLHFDWCITIKVGKKNLAHPTLKLLSVHPETPIKIPKLKLWTPNNGHLGIQSFSFGSVSGWTLLRNGHEISPHFVSFIALRCFPETTQNREIIS
jgi:hypothetical protein